MNTEQEAAPTSNGSKRLGWGTFVLVNALMLLVAILFVINHQAIGEWLASYFHAVPEPFVAVLRELGFAFLVAVALNFTIEVFNRRRHEQDLHDLDLRHEMLRRSISQHLVQEVFQRQLPEPIFREIQEHVLKAPYFRKGQVLRMTIRKLSAVAPEAGEDLAFVDEDYHFQLQNISGVAQPITIPASFTVHRGMSQIVTVVRVQLGEEVLTRADIDAARTVTSDVVTYVFKAKRELSPGESASIRIQSQNIRYCRDEYTLVPMMPSDGIRVEFVFPNEDFVAEATSVHPRPELDLSTPMDRCARSWEVPYGLFPCQGIWFSWKPSNAPQAYAAEKLAEISKAVQTWNDRRAPIRTPKSA